MINLKHEICGYFPHFHYQGFEDAQNGIFDDKATQNDEIGIAYLNGWAERIQIRTNHEHDLAGLFHSDINRTDSFESIFGPCGRSEIQACVNSLTSNEQEAHYG